MLAVPRPPPVATHLVRRLAQKIEGLHQVLGRDALVGVRRGVDLVNRRLHRGEVCVEPLQLGVNDGERQLQPRFVHNLDCIRVALEEHDLRAALLLRLHRDGDLALDAKVREEIEDPAQLAQVVV
jgi:hypothetical protein